MKKKAFTLAEVLITLTIIGVIAAITILIRSAFKNCFVVSAIVKKPAEIVSKN